jgi:hypothetical protein
MTKVESQSAPDRLLEPRQVLRNEKCNNSEQKPRSVDTPPRPYGDYGTVSFCFISWFFRLIAERKKQKSKPKNRRRRKSPDHRSFA